MKRVLVFLATLSVFLPGLAAAQAPNTPSLAEVARQEEARRKTAKKATRVLTNSNLNTEGLPPAPEPAAAGTPSRGSARPAAPDEDEEEDQGDAGAKKDQKYWQTRITGARADLSRTQMLAEAMQSRINALRNDVFNLDYPARGVAEKQLNASLTELDTLKKEVEAKTKAISAIEEEARRAGVPPGWLRP